MFEKEKLKEAIRSMTEGNDDWKAVLRDAPGAARLRVAVAFYANKFLDQMTQQEKDEYREFRENLEAQLDSEELKYLVGAFDRMGAARAVEHYRDLLEKKLAQERKEGGAPAGGAQDAPPSRPPEPVAGTEPAPAQGEPFARAEQAGQATEALQGVATPSDQNMQEEG